MKKKKKKKKKKKTLVKEEKPQLNIAYEQLTVKLKEYWSYYRGFIIQLKPTVLI